MVIKNNQIFRDFGERVAIKYAVGIPNIAVNIVVNSDRRIERQKMLK